MNYYLFFLKFLHHSTKSQRKSSKSQAIAIFSCRLNFAWKIPNRFICQNLSKKYFILVLSVFTPTFYMILIKSWFLIKKKNELPENVENKNLKKRKNQVSDFSHHHLQWNEISNYNLNSCIILRRWSGQDINWFSGLINDKYILNRCV